MKRYCLNWDDRRHCIGITALDSQHKELVAQVNRIAQSIDQKKPAGEINVLMDELVRLARAHFEFEEGLMTEHGFPGADAHAREHRGLLERLANLSEVMHTSNPHKVELVLAFITDWAELHLLQGEKVLGEYLSSKGLS